VSISFLVRDSKEEGNNCESITATITICYVKKPVIDSGIPRLPFANVHGSSHEYNSRVEYKEMANEYWHK
jgi:hypothetical protein